METINIEPRVSIIVPVYKAEAYLHRCIDSIIVQTFTNWELLLVDDGSPDRSGVICDEYAGKDERIKVFHKENGGVSSARNLGIDKAVGDWLCFIDSDDTIQPTYLDDFELDKIKSDIYIQGYVKIKKGKVVDKRSFANCKETDFLAILAYSEENYIINSPWIKLYKRSIVVDNDIRFDINTSYGEDHLFTLSYILFANSAHYSMGTGYIYRVSEGESLTQRIVPYNEITYYSLQAKKYQDKICEKTHSNEYMSVVGTVFITNYICTLKYLSQAKGCYSKYKWVRDRFLPEMKKIYTKGLSLKYKLIRSVTISSYFNALIYIAIKAKRL